jgi:hypothetical protein
MGTMKDLRTALKAADYRLHTLGVAEDDPDRMGLVKAHAELTAPEAEGRDTNIECAAEGCVNRKSQGAFVGAFCMPCHQALRRGDFSNPTTAAWGKLYADSLRTPSATQDAGLREAARKLIDLVWKYAPAHKEPHVCGPENQCDGFCVEVADIAQQVRDLERALSTPSPKAPATQVDDGILREAYKMGFITGQRRTGAYERAAQADYRDMVKLWAESINKELAALANSTERQS